MSLLTLWTALSGCKTYIVSAGLAGLAVYQFSTGDYQTGAATLLHALGFSTVRHAIATKL